MALYSSDLVFKDLNKEAEEILGYSKNQVLNKSILEVNALKEFNVDVSKLQSLLNGERKSYTIHRKTSNSFEQYLAFTTSLVTDGPHKQIIGVFHRNKKDLIDLSFVSDEFNNIERILAINPDLHYIMDVDSKKYLYQNTNILEHFGYSYEDLKGMNEIEFLISKIDHSSIREVALANQELKTAKDIGEFVEVEYKFMSKNDGWLWLKAKTTPLKQDKKASKVNLSYGILQDITESKRIQEKFNSQKLLLDNIADAIPDIIQVFDLSNSENIYSNFKGKTFLGYNEEAWNDHQENSLQLDLLFHINGNIEKIASLKPQEEFTQELKYHARSGGLSWIKVKIKVLNFDLEENPLQILCILSDIDEMKRDRDELVKSQNTNYAILHAMPDLLLTLSKDGFYNRVMSGVDFKLVNEKDILGKHVSDILDKEQASKILDLVTACSETGETMYYEFERKYGGDEPSKYFSNYFSKLNDDEVLVVVRDETQKKKAQLNIDEKVRLLSIQNKQLESFITKNSELERFAYIISHDLKEPLRSISAISELIDIELKKTGNDKLEDLLAYLAQNSSRMISLVEGVLEYSKIETKIKETEVNLNDVLQNVLRDLQQAIQEKFININLEQLPMVQGDVIQLRQLFQNLISNAIKFNQSLSPVIEIGSMEKNKQLVFFVKDNGIGIPDEFKGAVFKMCKRVNTYNTYPGQGIGLSICKKIIERHAGKIWVDDNKPNGTIFYFTLKA